MLLGILLLILAGIWSYGAWLFSVPVKLLLEGVCLLIRTVQYLPFASIAVPRIGLFGCALYYALVLAVISRIYDKAKYVQWCMKTAYVCMLVLTISSLCHSSYLKVHFINVGEGDSALLRTPGGITVLLDGGGAPEYSSKNVGKDTVVPYLHRSGVLSAVWYGWYLHHAITL